MSVEVILMADVKDLGLEGDIVTVSDGYARNYLLPRKLGAPVNAVSRKKLEKIRLQREELHRNELAVAREIAARVQGLSCTIPVKVNETDKLFGSVTSVHIAEALKAQGVDMDKHSVLLDEPIKELGVYDIRIMIHPEVEATVKIWVVEE